MREMKLIHYGDENYPEKLQKIPKSPFKLYAMGNIDLLRKPSLAVVGTRHITDYGVINCKNFAREIVEKDIPIVSGMAIGTDTVAHKTVLEYGGETIAVLGGGFDHIFPKQNIGLMEQILKQNGLVVTEYAPEVAPDSDKFLERNRIVSGLSEGVLIIEAGYRSGTSVTAKIARTQGKVVMALPGRLDSKYGVGVNKLIQEGAKLVTCIEDVVESFPQFMDKKGKTILQKQISFFDVKEEYKEILEILQGKVMQIEEIVAKTKEKDLRQTLNLLMNMELEGLIMQELGVGYRIKK